jgi:tetratricopeptide (TPR) repeat protein
MRDLVPSPTASPRVVRLCALVLILAVALAHWNGLRGVFTLDDRRDILENPTIRSLAPHPMPWSERGVMGSRPLVNYSFALNYALGGQDPLGYHIFNLAFHALSALLLFGIARRTLENDRASPRYGALAAPLALAVALVWGVHPLTTHALTYVDQRCESLMGFFYLAVVYCAVRGWHSERPRFWDLLAALCFLAGAACKEVIVTAPLMVWLYGILFEHGAPATLCRERKGLFWGFVPGLGLLVALAFAGGTWGSNPQYPAITPWQHLLNQPQALWTYLRLSLWPDALCFDYGWIFSTPGQAAPYLLVVFPLAAATAWGLWRRKLAAYPAAWFFVILLPSSSIVPLKEFANEYRMYLPLAGVCALAVLGVFEGLRAAFRWRPGKGRCRVFFLTLALLLVTAVGALGWRTHQRNRDYLSEVGLWELTASQRPGNERAQYNLGTVQMRLGNLEEARARLVEALRLYPERPETNNNLALVLYRLGRPGEALPLFLEAARLQPDLEEARFNSGTILNILGRPAEAVPHFEALVRLNPGDVKAWNNLGQSLGMLGRLDEALAAFSESLRLNPGMVEARHNLAMTLERLGRFEEALAQYREALKQKPDSPDLALKAAGAFLRLNRPAEALPYLREAIRLDPGSLAARKNLGAALANLGKPDDAAVQFREVLRLKPDDKDARESLRKLGR